MIRPLKSIAQKASNPRCISSLPPNFLGQHRQCSPKSLEFDHDERKLSSNQSLGLQQCRNFMGTGITPSAQLMHDDYDHMYAPSNNNDNNHYGTTTQFIASSCSNSRVNSLNDNQSNMIYRSNHNGINGNNRSDDKQINGAYSEMFSMNDSYDNGQNNINIDQSENLEVMANKLKSYASLQEALVDRDEGGDFSTMHAPRFSQFLLHDVLKIVREFDTTMDKPLFTQRELLSIVHTLILPRAEMTIPSHALKALLELAVLTVSRLNPKGRVMAATSTINNTTKTPQLTLDDGICCEELLRKLLAIKIYYTSKDQHYHYQDWSKSLQIILNITLNLYSTVASHLRDPSASKQIVQMAEKLLLQSASSSQQYYHHKEQQQDMIQSPEKLELIPDVISFNTVIMAWGKSVQTSHLQKQRNRHSKAAQKAGVAAAVRAQAILDLLLDLSKEDSNLIPTETSFNVALGAWANASPHSKIATGEAMQLLEDMANKHYKPDSFYPPPTAATLVTVSKVLCSSPPKDIHSHISKLLQYRDEFQLDPSDIILNNALLTAYARSARHTSSVHDNLDACKHMINFFDTELQTQQRPDRVSFLMALNALQDCARRMLLNNKEDRRKKEVEDFVLPTSRRLLRDAVKADVADTRMYNDVLGTHVCNAKEAQSLFDHHPRADYMAYVRLLEAYEQTAKVISAQNGNKTNTAKTITEMANRSEAILYELEILGKSTPSMRPQTNLYNAAILTHLERQSLEGVESAAGVLKRLLQKYKQRLQEYQENDSENRICERPNTTSFVSIMAGYLKHGRDCADVARVENLWGAMTDLQLAKSQVPPNMMKKVAPIQANVVAMNILLRMYTKYCNEQPQFLKQAEQLVLERMIPEPDEFSFTILLQAYGYSINNNINKSSPGKKDILERTMRLLQVARNQIQRPGLRFYNAALHTLSKCSSEEAALAAETILFEEMSSMKPDSYSYAAVVSAWTSLNTCEGAERAKDILLSSGALGVVDAFCFNTVLASFAKLGDMDQAEKLLEEMKRRGINTTAFTYQSLALGQSTNNRSNTSPQNQRKVHLQKDGDSSNQYLAYDQLQKLLSQYGSTLREDNKPSPRLFTHVLSKLSRVNDSQEKMLEVINQKLDLASSNNGRNEYLPTEYDVDSVIFKLASLGNIDQAIDSLEKLQNGGCQISTKAYNSILAAYAREAKGESYDQFEGAEKTMELMNQMKDPNAGSYAACIAAWLNCANRPCNKNISSQYDEEAENLLEKMNKRLGKNNDDERDISRAYHLGLKTCLKKIHDVVESEEKTESVRRGARIFAGMIQHQSTSPASYAYMLHLSKHIQPQSRQQLVCVKLIEECKASGQFSSSVLQTLLSIFSDSEVSNILQISRKKRISHQDLPPQWSVNVGLYERSY